MMLINECYKQHVTWLLFYIFLISKMKRHHDSNVSSGFSHIKCEPSSRSTP